MRISYGRLMYVRQIQNLYNEAEGSLNGMLYHWTKNNPEYPSIWVNGDALQPWSLTHPQALQKKRERDCSGVSQWFPLPYVKCFWWRMLTNDSKAIEERVKLMFDISAFDVMFMASSNLCLTQNYTYTMEVRIYFSDSFRFKNCEMRTIVLVNQR